MPEATAKSTSRVERTISEMRNVQSVIERLDDMILRIGIEPGPEEAPSLKDAAAPAPEPTLHNLLYRHTDELKYSVSEIYELLSSIEQELFG